MDYLLLNKMEFHAFHGVFDQEQKVGNTFWVELKIGGDYATACKTDRIEDALNYAAVFNEVKEEMKIRCNLIESLAENICKRLKNKFQTIQTIDIKVTKQNPPIQGQLESVSIVLTR